MRVLILWNTAATFNPLADWLIANGHEVRMVMRSLWDLGNCTKDHPSGIMVDSPMDFYRESIRQIRKFKPNIIHVNSSIKVLIISRLFALRTPIVFTYHGTDVRGRDKIHAEVRLADFITVSTPDLSKYGAWYDRPVCSMFHYRGGRIPNTALMLYNDNFPVDMRVYAREWCAERNIKLTMLDRTEPYHEQVPYYDMPEFLSRFEYYLDFKGFTGEQFALSKIAMEAFACGCKVFHESGQVISLVLPEHDEYYNLYTTLEKASRFTAFKRFFRVMYYLSLKILKR